MSDGLEEEGVVSYSLDGRPASDGCTEHVILENRLTMKEIATRRTK